MFNTIITIPKKAIDEKVIVRMSNTMYCYTIPPIFAVKSLVLPLLNVFTLCMYAQQGYAFACVYIYIYVAKKTGCLRSYHLRISCWCTLPLAH